MTKPARIAMLAGLALVVAGLVFGLVAGIFAENEARLVTYDAYRPTFLAVMQDASSGEWQAALERANQRSMSQRRAATVHTHSVNMGMLLILVALLAPLLAQLRTTRPSLLWAMITAAWVYPLGLLLKYAGLVPWGEALAALGAGLAIAVLAWLYLGVSRALAKVARY